MALPRDLASPYFLGWSLCFQFFRRAGVHARRTLEISKSGPCGGVGSLGTMRASSPTEVCYKARFVIFRLAAGPPWFVGEGFIPPAGVCAAARSGGMRVSRPTVARVVEAAPVGRAFAMVRRGGPWPSRGSLLRCGVSGTMQASSPTKVYYNPEVAVSRLAAGLPWFVGEGFIPPAGVCAGAGSGGMRASRPTVARVVEAAPVGQASSMVCRGGPWPSRGTLRQCGVPRDDASIVPYRGLL